MSIGNIVFPAEFLRRIYAFFATRQFLPLYLFNMSFSLRSIEKKLAILYNH